MAGLLCILAFPNAIWASDKEGGALQYQITVIAGAERFVDILEYPTYLAIALQNKAFRVADLYEVKIKDYQTFESKGTELKFIKRTGDKFFYQIKLGWSIIYGKALPSLTMVVDASELRNKVVTVTISSSFVKYLPENVRERISAKIQKISSEDKQLEILKYFNELSRASYRHNELQGILSGIMIDAYNMHISDNGQIYKADIKSSQLNNYSVFIYIVTAFLIIIPIYMLKKSGAKDRN